jgi:hypothetical protein
MDKIHYRAVMKFFVKKGLTPNEIHSKFIKKLWVIRTLPKTQTLPRWSAFFFESKGDCSCGEEFCRSYEEPLQGRDNDVGASLE